MALPALHIQTSGGGFTLPITHQPIMVGRAADNQIQLQDELVAPYHCVLLRIADEVHVVDLRSQAGTLLNDKPVRFARIMPGDVLRIGHAQVQLSTPFPAAATPAPPPSRLQAVRDHRADALMDDDPAAIPVVSPSGLRPPVIARGDRDSPIKVAPDADLDKPAYAPPPQHLGELLLPREMDAHLRASLKRESGMLVVCGPSESGRSTTVYAMLRHLSAARRTIATFEQPPEFQLEGAAQYFVHNEAEYATLMERVLHDPPGVLMLGDPPPRQAANIALRAAIGRCLVICVADAPDAITLISNWIDTGVQPRNLAASLGMVVAQRLVRRLCDRCKSAAPLGEHERHKLAPFLPHIQHIYTPDACPACNNTGYVGHIGVFEVLQIGDELRGMILAPRPTAENLRRAIDHKHFVSLRLSAYARVAQGLTSIDQADRLFEPGAG